MKKEKSFIYILAIIFILTIIGVFVYYFISKNTLKPTNASVKDLDTNVTLDTSDEKLIWSNYEKREINLEKSITITEGGVYNLSGTIEDGLITIKTDKEVLLNLNNVSITNSNGPAIYIESANTVVISTILNTTNTLTDSVNYSGFDEDVEGVIYSKDDLVLEGEGTLIINGKKTDGIVSKDDLKINSGTYLINTADDGIRGKDSLYILDGTFTINSSGDGIKSTNDTESDKGYVKIENGTFNIKSTLDGIQAETKVLISGGIFNIETGGGSINSSTNSGWGTWGKTTTIDSKSAKGIKGQDNIVLTGGTYNLDTSDDAIHSNSYIGINGGTYTISSGDDGIHADKELIVDSGEIDITKSYEGLEAETITINNGTISVISSDDGLNAAGGNDSSAMNRPGSSPKEINSKSTLTINGGNIYVNASGDGLDANGTIYINGGYIIVDGPSNSGNGALDYDTECIVTGGTLIALGTGGMSQGISNSSTQYGILINLSNNYSGGTKISILDSNDKELLSYTSNKSFSSIVYSSNNLSKGKYTLKINDNAYLNVEINNISTTIGNSGMNGGNRTMR